MIFNYINMIGTAVNYVTHYAYMVSNIVWEYMNMLYYLYLFKFSDNLGLVTIDVGWSGGSALDTIDWHTFIYIFTSLILPLIILLISLISRWKIFEKAGEKGWKSIIPFYSTFTFCKITFGSGWYLLLVFIPFVDLIMYIMMYIKLGKKFNKGKLFTLGLVFLTPIFILVLAFDKSEYSNELKNIEKQLD